MRNILSYLIFCMIVASGIYAQDLAMNIYYLAGEKSKDSHSSSEKFSIAGNSVSYSIEYSGRKGKNEEDMNKVCTFSDEDIKNIRETILAKELNVNDSLFDKDSKSKSFEVYTNISISITMEGINYKIKINGDTIGFNDKKLYKNSIYLITLLRKMVKDC